MCDQDRRQGSDELEVGIRQKAVDQTARTQQRTEPGCDDNRRQHEGDGGQRP